MSSQSSKELPATGIKDQQSPPQLPPLSQVSLNGLKLPIFFGDLKWIKSMKDMKLRPDDIWIVTYPKCGTTWMQQIVRLILVSQGKDDGAGKLSDAIPWVESFCDIPSMNFSYHVDVDSKPSPRAFKSHFPYDMMPCGPPNTTPGKYICVLRNPKDVAVSFFHHDRRIPFYPLYEWDEYFEKFMKGDLDFGNYFDHVLSWWAHKDDENVLIVKYEDMQKDLSSIVSRVAEFIGEDISKEALDDIVHKTTFANMKNDSSANYKWTEKMVRPKEAEFMRKGVVGDWKNYFTPEQSARLDTVYAERLASAGIELEFD